MSGEIRLMQVAAARQRMGRALERESRSRSPAPARYAFALAAAEDILEDPNPAASVHLVTPHTTMPLTYGLLRRLEWTPLFVADTRDVLAGLATDAMTQPPDTRDEEAAVGVRVSLVLGADAGPRHTFALSVVLGARQLRGNPLVVLASIRPTGWPA